MSNELTTTSGGSMDEMERMAKAIAESKLFGIQTASQALVLMMLCRSEGKDPIQAVKTYHLIGGKPSMRADAMLAEYQARGGKVQWGERTNERVSAVFFHASSGDVPVTWTIADAKQAGLLQNPTWSKYPRQMLTARVISEGIRTSLPGVVSGIYTPEEVMQFDDKPTSPGAYGSSSLIEGAPVNLPEPARITSAPNPPAPADDAPLRAAKSAFARNAKALGLDILNENGKFSNAKLSVLLALVTDLDIEAEGGEWSADDWDHGTELLPGYVEALKAAEAEPAAAAVAPEVDADAVDDPFATSAPLEPNPGMSYAEHETTARGGRK